MANRKIDNPPLLLREEFGMMFDSLPDNEAGKLIKALIHYRWDGTIPELSGTLQGVFIALRAFADKDEDKYRQTCENNQRAAQKRWNREKNNVAENEEQLESDDENEELPF